LGRRQPVCERRIGQTDRRAGRSGIHWDARKAFASGCKCNPRGVRPGKSHLTKKKLRGHVREVFSEGVDSGTRLALEYQAITARGESRVGSQAVDILVNGGMRMRKFISSVLASVVLCGFTVVFSGCTEESGTKTEVKSTSPDGSTTRETREIKVEKKGENAPLAPSEKR
jgi:hypothetical protein